jgi:hypothetical protein
MPCEQFVHAVAPDTFEYAPAAQFVHKLPDKYCPAAHVRVKHAVLAAFDTCPVGQGTQAD